MRAGANPKFKSPALANNAGLHQNFPEPLKNSPSCLADCFTWPQVALTHHVLSTAIETLTCGRVNLAATLPRYREILRFSIYQLRFTIYALNRCDALSIPARSIP